MNWSIWQIPSKLVFGKTDLLHRPVILVSARVRGQWSYHEKVLLSFEAEYLGDVWVAWGWVSDSRFRLRSWSHGLWDRAPSWALCWQPAWDSLSLPLSLCPSPSLSLSLSLSQNKQTLKNYKQKKGKQKTGEKKGTEPDAGLELTDREIMPRSDAQPTEPPRRPFSLLFWSLWQNMSYVTTWSNEIGQMIWHVSGKGGPVFRQEWRRRLH